MNEPEAKLAPDRERLRRSVMDLRRILGKLTGGECPLVADEAKNGAGLPIYIAERAAARIGPLERSLVPGQTLRLVVGPDFVALHGDSDLAASYAVYTLLDELGCRWYLPGPLGEHIPQLPSVELGAGDRIAAPSTLYRGLWYADDDFERRNRLGGQLVAAGHALERYVTAEQRAAHPEWRALIDGKPHASRLEWHLPEVADAIAAAVEQRLAKTKSNTASLAPADGMELSTSPGDTALDAGDFMAAAGVVSATDRFLVLANRVAGRVAKQHPDVVLGMLAYARTFQPPRREPVDPHLVPVFAPITACRAHPLTDTGCPSQRALRDAIDGWSRRAKRVGYRGYLYNLSEPTAPNPLIKKLSAEIPYYLSHGVAFWQPETLPSFEASLPGLWLSIRLPWDAGLTPSAALADLYGGFYGAAAAAMRAYWEYVDSLWVDTPEHAGASRSYLRRFTPERMARARELMNAALGAARTPLEHARVTLADESLALFERFMSLQQDLWAGRFAGLERGAARWKALVAGLSVLHEREAAFGLTGWAGAKSAGGAYFERFLQPTYDDAARIARFRLLTRPPLRRWRLRFDVTPSDPCEAPGLDESGFRETDVATETWATLGRGEYFGGACYRAPLALKPERPGETSYLWLGRYDGKLRVYADGVELVPVGPDFEPQKAPSAHGPQSFALPRTARARSVVIAVRVVRETLEELGGGGLQGPVGGYGVRNGRTAPSRGR